MKTLDLYLNSSLKEKATAFILLSQFENQQIPIETLLNFYIFVIIKPTSWCCFVNCNSSCSCRDTPWRLHYTHMHSSPTLHPSAFASQYLPCPFQTRQHNNRPFSFWSILLLLADLLVLFSWHKHRAVFAGCQCVGSKTSRPHPIFSCKTRCQVLNVTW